MTDSRTCPICGTSLEGRRSNVRYCSPQCRKDAEVDKRKTPENKAKRRAKDRQRNGITSDRIRKTETPEEVELKYGFKVREGYGSSDPWDF